MSDDDERVYPLLASQHQEDSALDQLTDGTRPNSFSNGRLVSLSASYDSSFSPSSEISVVKEIPKPTKPRRPIMTHVIPQEPKDASIIGSLNADYSKETTPLLPSTMVKEKRSYRLHSIDLLRGVIVIIMAWDHCKDFISSYKGYDGTVPSKPTLFSFNHTEFWYGELELYSGKPEYLFARFISHFCAPGFALLMGLGMVLLSISRRTRQRWSSWRILRFFLLRGFILIALGFVVRAANLVLLINPSEQVKELAGHPAVANLLTSFFQVMTCLGLQMIFLSLILEVIHLLDARFKLHQLRLRFFQSDLFVFSLIPTTMFILGCLCTAATTIVIHQHQHGDASKVTPVVAKSFQDIMLRFFLVPGPFGDANTRIGYPVLPWLTLSLWGAAMGWEFKSNPKLAHARQFIHGSLLIICFVIVRLFGGTKLNLRGLPMHEGEATPWNAWWTVCKYPPSLAYISITVGTDLIVLYLLSLVNPSRLWAQIVLHYGRSPLAFYITHFYFITTISLIIYSVQHSFGVQLYYVVPIYVLVIILEYAIVYYYDKFKSNKSPDSLWRLL